MTAMAPLVEPPTRLAAVVQADAVGELPTGVERRPELPACDDVDVAVGQRLEEVADDLEHVVRHLLEGAEGPLVARLALVEEVGLRTADQETA